MKPLILVVEDDQQTRITLSYQLEYAGYRVMQAADGETAIPLLNQETFNVVITDIIMGELTGMDVLQVARQQPYKPQVILLTGHGTLDTALKAFRKGAHDYLLKPCEPEDLLLCVEKAVQRHEAEYQLQQAASILSGHETSNHYPAFASSSSRGAFLPGQRKAAQTWVYVGELAIGHTRHDVSFSGKTVRLTPIEYTLLYYLAERPGEVCRFGDIVQRTHGFRATDSEAQQLLKPHIHNLRRKLAPNYLVSHRGIGYMLVNPEP